jgi:hypothetical protein
MHAAKKAGVRGKLCPLRSRDGMIGEKELTKRLMACIEIELRIPPYQMGMANLIVRRIAPKVLEIIKEEARTARREDSVEIEKNR